MDWTKIIHLISAGACLILLIKEKNLIRKTDALLEQMESDYALLQAMPRVIPCYECRFYLEEEPSCPKSGMKMKDGLIFCCYGEREEEGSDEWNTYDNG